MSANDQVLHQVQVALGRFPEISVAAVFGSAADGTASPGSDVDVAVQASHELDADTKIALIESIALETGRAVDLVDIRRAGQPLLDQIVTRGVQIAGTRQSWAQLIYRNVLDQADFVPYQQRILEGRRSAWINS